MYSNALYFTKKIIYNNLYNKLLLQKSNTYNTVTEVFTFKLFGIVNVITERVINSV